MCFAFVLTQRAVIIWCIYHVDTKTCMLVLSFHWNLNQKLSVWLFDHYFHPYLGHMTSSKRPPSSVYDKEDEEYRNTLSALRSSYRRDRVMSDDVISSNYDLDSSLASSGYVGSRHYGSRINSSRTLAVNNNNYSRNFNAPTSAEFSLMSSRLRDKVCTMWMSHEVRCLSTLSEVRTLFKELLV